MKFYNLKYDVEKTNSLTTPYTATISGNHIWIKNGKPKQMEKFVLHAEYRNAEWVYSHSEGEQTIIDEDGYVAVLPFDPENNCGYILAHDLRLKVPGHFED